MKIVYLANSIIPSKTANSIHIMKMCQAFADNGNEVILVVPNRYKEQIKNINNVYSYYNVRKNFKIIFVKYMYLRYIGIINHSINVFIKLSDIKPDFVYGRDFYSCFLSSFKYSTAIEIHAPLNNRIKEWMLNRIVKNKKFKKVIVISKILKNLIICKQNIIKNNIYVAHDGADERYDFNTKVKSIIENKKLNIGYVGSLYKGKGIEVIENIAPYLPEMMFHIVGGRNDDIEYWKKKINVSNVIFYGFLSQEKINKYLNSFDICLLPNQIDVYINNNINKNSNIGEYTSPLKMFEYMASKTPIVASDIPVLCEVLNHNSAILVDSKDYKGWINSLELLRSKELREKLLKNANEDFILNYTWKVRAKNIIKECINV